MTTAIYGCDIQHLNSVFLILKKTKKHGENRPKKEIYLETPAKDVFILPYTRAGIFLINHVNTMAADDLMYCVSLKQIASISAMASY